MVLRVIGIMEKENNGSARNIQHIYQMLKPGLLLCNVQ